MSLVSKTFNNRKNNFDLQKMVLKYILKNIKKYENEAKRKLFLKLREKISGVELYKI